MKMLLVVNILLIICSAIAEGLSYACCPVKHVYHPDEPNHEPKPDQIFHHVGFDDSAMEMYGCNNPCVYMNDYTDREYCFADGDQDFKCDDKGQYYSKTPAYTDPMPPTDRPTMMTGPGGSQPSMMPGTDGPPKTDGPPITDGPPKTDGPAITDGPPKTDGPAMNMTTSSGCICPAVYTPVCGLDGVTYSNACSAKCEGNTDKKCEGPCPCPVCTCEPVGQKVCGKDGITYPNEDCATCNYTEVVCLGECPCLT